MKWLLILVLAISFIFPKISFASSNCDNRYLTLVNPVRSRDLWIDRSLQPVQLQYNAIAKNNFSATWLLQSDVLSDPELVAEIKKFNSQQELGTFLEVSPKLAQQARVIYPVNTPWYYPQAVFLSGYNQTDRKKIIDTMMASFKKTFGYFPKSIGAWWIDSYSLNYLKNRYRIVAAMIVADQKSTDNYGVWGQWWGAAYFPQKANILTPASSLDNKLDLVVTQWAQRDPIKAYGSGKQFSNYSLQANDYINLGLNTDYFKSLSQIYLDCQNPIGQITVGMETGIEGFQYIDEYNNQLNFLSQQQNLKSVTLSQFYQQYKSIYPEFPDQYKIGTGENAWNLTPQNRRNNFLQDQINYQNNISFSDYFLSDQQNFLQRILPVKEGKINPQPYFPWYIIIFLIGLIFAYKKNLFKIWLFWVLVSASWFGLVFRSFGQFGWWVFFGPAVGNLVGTQIILSLIIALAIFISQQYWPMLIKKKQQLLFLLPLTVFIDGFVSIWRYTQINGYYYLGLNIDSFKFIGISFTKSMQLEFVNQDFSNLVASSLLKFDFNKIWNNLWLAFLIYPLFHLILGVLLFFLIPKLPKKIQIFFISLMIFFYLVWVWHILKVDPRAVLSQS